MKEMTQRHNSHLDNRIVKKGNGGIESLPDNKDSACRDLAERKLYDRSSEIV
jgi:hypothetical protein